MPETLLADAARTTIFQARGSNSEHLFSACGARFMHREGTSSLRHVSSQFLIKFIKYHGGHHGYLCGNVNNADDR
jgi:hypothetical protein